jgi:hypothetical protein
MVGLLKPVDEIKGVGPCGTVLIAGAAGHALPENLGRFIVHECLDLLRRLLLAVIHILTSHQTIAAKITFFSMPHEVSSLS